MTPVQAIILGCIQGLTEFLPVSSSGHLVLFQHIFGLRQPELMFDVAVHLGTLTAVCVYFYRDIGYMIAALSRWVFKGQWRKERRGDAMPADVRLALMIIAGSVPTAVIGVGFESIAEVLFSSVLLVGAMLMATGFWMWFTRGRQGKGEGVSGLRLGRALMIGTAQGIAVIPGISRSGATIAAGLYLGLDRETAARFSFLLSIPAIVGAAAISLSNAQIGGSAQLMSILLGAAAAAFVGYGALALLVYIVKKGHLHRFSPYCWIAGGIALMLAW